MPLISRSLVSLQRGCGLQLVWLALGSPALAEIAAAAEPDALVLDLQHGLWERHALEAAIGLTRWQLPAIVRTMDCSAAAVGTALDAGAAAVLAPMVEDAHQAHALVQAGRYPPAGRRSAGGVRPLLGGAAALQETGRQVALGAMVETAHGVAEAQGICRVEGLDFIFIGSGDLGLSLGVAPDSPRLQQACLAVREAAHAEDLPCGIFTSDAEAARAALAEGYDMAVCASDIGLLQRGFHHAVQRKGLPVARVPTAFRAGRKAASS